VQHSSLQLLVYACKLHMNSLNFNIIVSVYQLVLDAVETEVVPFFAFGVYEFGTD
jgi:hypothetical protein